MQYVTLCCAYVTILCKVFSMSDFKTLQKSYHCWRSFSFSCLFRYSCICKFVPKTQGFVTLELRQITVLGIKYSLFIIRLESFPLDWTFLVVFFLYYVRFLVYTISETLHDVELSTHSQIGEMSAFPYEELSSAHLLMPVARIFFS